MFHLYVCRDMRVARARFGCRSSTLANGDADFFTAYVDMGGRFFGGRQIQASFYEEERFVAGDYVSQRE